MHTTCSVMELQKTAYQMSPEFCEAGGKMNKYAHTEFFSYNSIKKNRTNLNAKRQLPSHGYRTPHTPPTMPSFPPLRHHFSNDIT